MGWIEQLPDGRQVDHDFELVGADQARLPSDMVRVDGLPEPGRARPDVRAGCTCGWAGHAAGPRPPAPSERDVALWCDFLRWPPGSASHGWESYLLRAWQSHIALVIAGTNADDPAIAAQRGIMALLDDVRAHPTRSLHALAEVREALAAAVALAVAEAEAHGLDSARIAQFLRSDLPVARNR
jgi:hypothetical protein